MRLLLFTIICAASSAMGFKPTTPLEDDFKGLFCMGTDNYDDLNEAIAECQEEIAFMAMDDNEPDVHADMNKIIEGGEPFSLKKFVQGTYMAQRCVMQKLGWLSPGSTEINTDVVIDMINQSGVKNSFRDPQFTLTTCRVHAMLANVSELFEELDCGMTAIDWECEDEYDEYYEDGTFEDSPEETFDVSTSEEFSEETSEESSESDSSSASESSESDSSSTSEEGGKSSQAKKAGAKKAKAKAKKAKAKRAKAKKGGKRGKRQRGSKQPQNRDAWWRPGDKDLSEEGHTCIALPGQEPDEEVIVDLSDEYNRLSREEQEEIDELLYPMLFCKCIRRSIATECQSKIDQYMDILEMTMFDNSLDLTDVYNLFSS